MILTGAGNVFCAGMGLAEFAQGGGDKIAFEGGILDLVCRTHTTPVIAAVQGAAMAGRFEIMLACDLVFVAEDALLGVPEVPVGLIAGAGGVAHLPKRIPVALARKILTVGEPITAQRSYEAELDRLTHHVNILKITAKVTD